MAAMMYVGGADSAPPSCQQSMRVSSDLFGHSPKLVPELQVGGQPRSVLLDTGLSGYLLGSKSAIEDVTLVSRGRMASSDIGGRQGLANMRAATVDLVIAGQPFKVLFPVYVDSDIPWPILLGAGALRDMDFVLDFRNGRQCFALHPDLK
ncbi:MAG: hypothetical protein QM601_04910 [Pseudoxanthomonas sp.]